MNTQCPECSSFDTQRRGTRNQKQRYSCKVCSHWFSVPIERPNEANILLFDIETCPGLVYAFQTGKDYIGWKQFYQNPYILSWSAKWMCEDVVMSDVLTPKESLKMDERRILRGIWKLLCQADIVVTQNGDRFDLGHLNAMFLKYGFNPPTPYSSLDLLPRNRKKFNFLSYSQGWITEQFGLTQKTPEMILSDWKKCKHGDPKALQKMVEYNRNDVRGLEDIYFLVRAWIPNHPNVTLYGDLTEKGCHRCGSKSLIYEGQYATVVNLYDTLRCTECGGITRERKTKLKKWEREVLTGGMAQ